MSILKDDDLSIEAAKRATYRLHAVATKLNLEETQAFASLAKKRGCKRGDLLRQLVLAELGREAAESSASTELTEIMGIRLMLTNLFRPLATGQKLTPEAFDNMVAEVKKRKRSVAEDAMQDLERA